VSGHCSHDARTQVYQEAVSAVSIIPPDAYELNAAPRFVTFGFEYHPDWNGDGSGDITWYIDGERTWTVRSDSIPARPDIGISQRIIPTEPMSVSGARARAVPAAALTRLARSLRSS